MSAQVIELPANARELNAVRQATCDMARRYGRDEEARLRAFGHAMDLMREGASSAWAVQAARQDLRPRTCDAPLPGGAA